MVAATAMVQEEHVPVNGYNADEVRAFLATGRGGAQVDGVKGGKVPVWKAGGENKGVRSGGPWGSKRECGSGGTDCEE